MLNLRIIILVVASVVGAAVASGPAHTISHEQALAKVRSVVAPLCGEGRRFACTIANDARPKRCSLEYLVLGPRPESGARPVAVWVGLDHRGRIISLEANREQLCPSA